MVKTISVIKKTKLIEPIKSIPKSNISNITIPEECKPGPPPQVACQTELPKIIYKVNRYINPISPPSQFIFVGNHLENEDLKGILETIEKNGGSSLDIPEIKLLEEIFGSEYRGILGLTNQLPKQFIPEFIERDDTIEKIKGKIQLHLDIGKYKDHMPQPHIQMPVSLQYFWAPNCHRQANTVVINEELMGFFYYYNLKPEEIEALIASLRAVANTEERTEDPEESFINGIQVSQIEQEIQKLQLYLQESLSNKKPTKRTKRLVEVPVIEDYRQVSLYTSDPFDGIPSDPTTYDPTFDGLFVKLNGEPVTKTLLDDQNDKILQDYLLTGSHTVHLLNLVDFLNYLKEKTAFKNYLIGPTTDQTSDQTFKRLVNGFLRKYWPETRYPKAPGENVVYFNLENFVRGYQTSSETVLKKLMYDEKTKYTKLVDRLIADRAKIAIINNKDIDIGIEFSKCRILEVVLHINYLDQTSDFVDLLKIFDLYPLSETVPHAKYRGETVDESFHKIYKGISKVIPKEELTRWVSDKPVKIKTEDSEIIRYTFSGKGLSYKVKLYEIPDAGSSGMISKYGTLNIYKDGKIELKASWDESMSTDLNTLKIMMVIFKGVIEDINKIQYHMRGVDRRRRIGVPDENFIGNPYSNTQLVLINTSTLLNFLDKGDGDGDGDGGDGDGGDGNGDGGNGGEIDFNELNKLAQCFHKTYASVIRTDISLVETEEGVPQITTMNSNTLKLRYKRISFYEEMSEYDKLVYELKQQYVKLTKETLVSILRQEFSELKVRKDEADQIAEAILAKKIKHPGIDVKILKLEDQDQYKILILGTRSFLQLSEVHFYVQQLLFLYRNSKMVKNWNNIVKSWTATGDCQIDLESLKRANPELALEEELREAEELKQKMELSSALERALEEAEMALFGEEEAEAEGEAEAEAEAEAEEEELGLGEPPEEGEAEELEKGVKAIKIAKGKKKAEIAGRISSLSRLEKADSDLFARGYATSCQKSDFRQPMVIPTKRRNDLIKDLTQEKAKLHGEITTGGVAPAVLSKKQQTLRDIQMKLDLLGDNHGITCRDDNFYFCPIAFCYTCEMILMPDDIAEHKAKFGHQSIYLISPGKMKSFDPVKSTFGHHDYIGFLDPGKHPDGLCMPCCFKKPKQKKQYYNQCFNTQCLGKTGVEEEIVEAISPLYVFNSEKRYITKDRYAFLPKDLSVILNQNRPSIAPFNCETVNGNIRTGTSFNCHLRKGMSSQVSEVKNVFLNAIGNVMNPPMNGTELREFLIEKISPEMFQTLLDGNLKLIFSDEAGETDPFGNFIEYLSNDYINEDFLWDFVTAPDVILEDGFNLIIFEAELNRNRTIANIMLKCPLGYNLNELFKPGRPSVILYKYQNHYEPIYRVFDQESNLMEEKFYSSNDEMIQNILAVYQECVPMDDPMILKNLREFYQKNDLPNIPFEPARNAEKTFDILEQIIATQDQPELAIVAQVVDEMNKVTHLVLENGLKLPVKPSRIITEMEIPTRAYYTDVELLEIDRAESENRAPVFDLPDFPETFSLMYDLNQWSSDISPEEKLNTVPRMNLLDDTGAFVVGILLNNGLIIEVPAYPIEELDKVQIKLVSGTPIKASEVGHDIQSYQKELIDRGLKERGLVDLAIKSRKGDFEETRVTEVHKALFEEETYQRLRFELSRFLQLPDKMPVPDESLLLKDKIQGIIDDSDKTVKEKRSELYALLLPLIETMTTIVVDDPDYVKKYKQPNVRILCFEQNKEKDCSKDPHCRLVDSGDGKKVCKLFIPERNLQDPNRLNIPYYVHLLVDEFVRNPFKSQEILEDQIDTYIKRDVRQTLEDELLFYEEKGKDASERHEAKQRKVKKLYQKGIDYEEQWRTHPEIGKQKTVVEQQAKKAQPLAIYWQNLIGPETGLKWIPDTGSHDFIYDMIGIALNQREIIQGKPAIYDKTVIKDQVWNYIENEIDPAQIQLDPLGRPGWQLFLHNLYEILSPVTTEYKKESTKEGFKENLYMTPRHILTHHELALISRIFDVNFIILRDHRYPGEISEAETSWIICLNTTQTKSDWYILLYLVAYEKYNMIADTAIYVKNSPEPNRYIFKQTDEIKHIPTSLFDKWQRECPNDHKATLDIPIATLVATPTPEPVFLRSARTSGIYPVSPRTGQVEAEPPARPPEAIIVSPRMKKIVRGIIIRKKPVEKPPEPEPVPEMPAKKTIKRIIPLKPKEIAQIKPEVDADVDAEAEAEDAEAIASVVPAKSVKMAVQPLEPLEPLEPLQPLQPPSKPEETAPKKKIGIVKRK